MYFVVFKPFETDKEPIVRENGSETLSQSLSESGFTRTGRTKETDHVTAHARRRKDALFNQLTDSNRKVRRDKEQQKEIEEGREGEES